MARTVTHRESRIPDTDDGLFAARDDAEGDAAPPGIRPVEYCRA